MPKRPFAATALPIVIDRGSEVPLHRQLYLSLRRAILEGRLSPGQRLPSTRSIAQAFSLGRTVVLVAFDQLLAEGFVTSHVGSGTYVSEALRRELLGTHASGSGRGTRPSAPPIPSGTRCIGVGPLVPFDTGAAQPFWPALPALDRFPWATWARSVTRSHRRPPAAALLGYGDPLGYLPLRRFVAAYLGRTRAVQCTPEQVVIVAGAQQGIDFIARLLLERGDIAWTEHPGFPPTRRVLEAWGADVHSAPVDTEGFDVGAARALGLPVRLVAVTPSFQYPLGITMSVGRRLELLAWAREASAWVVENDYDSTYRYVGQPLASLQGLDRDGRVIYVGTFSNVLFPALRIGYVVMPSALIEVVAATRIVLDRQPPIFGQIALADFLESGNFERHIRQMAALYAERQATLVAATRAELGGLLDVQPAHSGMHLVGWLPVNCSDRHAAELALAAGVRTPPLSSYASPSAIALRPGVLLGYPSIGEREIRRAVSALTKAWGTCGRHKRQRQLARP